MIIEAKKQGRPTYVYIGGEKIRAGIATRCRAGSAYHLENSKQ